MQQDCNARWRLSPWSFELVVVVRLAVVVVATVAVATTTAAAAAADLGARC